MRRRLKSWSNPDIRNSVSTLAATTCSWVARPATLREIDRLMPFFENGAKEDGFEGGVRVAFPSPSFTPFFRGGALYQKSSVSGSGLTVSSDYELMLRIGGAGYPFVFLADALIRYRIVASGLSGPADLREFTWGLDGFLVFRAHAAIVDPRHRGKIAERLREKTRSLARRAYYHGERVERAWSRRYLARLTVRSRRPHLVVPFLVAALLPPWVVELASRVLSRSYRGCTAGHDVRGRRQCG